MCQAKDKHQPPFKRVLYIKITKFINFSVNEMRLILKQLISDFLMEMLHAPHPMVYIFLTSLFAESTSVR